MTFTSPFHWTIWLCLICISFVGSTAIWIFHKYPRNQDNLSFFEALCITSSSIFGLGIKDANDVAGNVSERLTLFTFFICGSLYFYTYCGFLTSSLAVPNDKIPFSSPEGILKTNYRYIQFLQGTFIKTNIIYIVIIFILIQNCY